MSRHFLLAASLLAAAAVLPSATAQPGRDDIVRKVDKPDVRFFDARTGKHRDGLRCGVKDMDLARSDAFEGALRSRQTAAKASPAAVAVAAAGPRSPSRWWCTGSPTAPTATSQAK